MQSLYVPAISEIKNVRSETHDVKTFRFQKTFDYAPGQFIELSMLGVGECPISITSSPTQDFLEISVKLMGSVTSALHDLEKGDNVYIRGPYGNGFPVETLKNREIVFVGGGIGLAPLRSLINYLIDTKNYKKIYILYGARTPKDLVFKDELERWSKVKDVEVHTTVDCRDDDWCGCVGVVGALLNKIKPCSDAVAVTCGPPIMIRFVSRDLSNMGFTDDRIILSMERMMKCGVGKCGHCNIGEKYMCVDGPVFTLFEMKKNREFKI